jgi:hypothetical protein
LREPDAAEGLSGEGAGAERAVAESMIKPITESRWREAQVAELTATSYDLKRSRESYGYVFNYLGMSFNQEGKTIAEIGCGPFPAVMFCENVRATVFEPLFSKPAHCGGNILWEQVAFENYEHNLTADEVWLFNVLQHVRDPEIIITRAKQYAPVIRFFEPVDYPTCIYHPHTFTEADFHRWFGDAVRRYIDRLPGFFDADCCYGTWNA